MFTFGTQVRFGFKIFGLARSEVCDWVVNMTTTVDGVPESENKSLAALAYEPDFVATGQPWWQSDSALFRGRCTLHITNHQLWVDDWATPRFGDSFSMTRFISISGTARDVAFSAALTIARVSTGF